MSSEPYPSRRFVPLSKAFGYVEDFFDSDPPYAYGDCALSLASSRVFDDYCRPSRIQFLEACRRSDDPFSRTELGSRWKRAADRFKESSRSEICVDLGN